MSSSPQEVLHSMRSKKKLQWMAIKINLEKAYDKVRWDFVEASLNAAGIPSYLVKVIMNAILSSSMQVLWNGAPTQKFSLARSIRQCCPLSPYLFVLCMEWLGHRFHAGISLGEWSPIWLSHSGQNLSHLFFADDLVIFSRADLTHIGILENCLRIFCELSGHKVNIRKTNIFFSTSVNEFLRSEINGILRFQEVNDLGHYLGVSLFHKRVTNSILNFLIERVRNQLSSWDTKRLSFAGRVTFAYSVLMAIPSYLMQSTLVLKGICNSIEELAKQFIWGAAEGKMKLALVGWNNICQLKLHGEEVVSRIISIPPPLISAGPDTLSWSRTMTGVFSMRSAYFLLKEESWNPKDVNWNTVWKISGPQRVKQFICFFVGNISEWFLSNLHFHPSIGANISNWSCLSGILLWCIWKNQNLIIFHGNSMSTKDIINTSYSWAKHFSSSQITVMDSRPNKSPIHQNSGTCFYLNTDCAVHYMSGFSAVGGVRRDDRGQWILGYNRPLGKCTAAVAELWGILDGLLLLQK
ncbi:hypothetical protein PVK06_026524 [Gossypium arboreum]|uniref:Reverse transcriptase domain-containing protein n=1 Tax=Gossypium arboreum TaxID=29729 RepID=A0ABR0NXX0_GOSAR|nr:hypothetical protein PVK06_026524 [Gossypium arboreum]